MQAGCSGSQCLRGVQGVAEPAGRGGAGAAEPAGGREGAGAEEDPERAGLTHDPSAAHAGRSGLLLAARHGAETPHLAGAVAVQGSVV